MFSGWFTEAIQDSIQQERIRKEAREKFKKEHPVGFKVKSALDTLGSWLLFILGILWLTVLPAYGLYSLVAPLF